MITVRYFTVPPSLQPYVERALLMDFTGAVGFSWQFLPTGCYGMTLLVGPAGQDFELENPLDDGAFSGVPPRAMGTWCARSCLAFGVALTPYAAVHLPLLAHDFDATFAVHSEALLGRVRLASLRRRVRAADTVEAKMHAYLQWVEALLRDGPPAYGRAAAIADVATAMRQPQPPGVDEAAHRVGVRRRQFERDFARYLGMSPKRYATIARVQQVAQLAWQGMGLAGIAAELGFVDQAHMSHVVREVTGLAPAALLQRAAASELTRATRPFSGGRITHL